MQPSFLQSKQWADFKQSQGWQPHKENDIFVLERKLPLGKSLLYAPEVFISNLSEISKISKISKTISDSLIFFRLEIINPITPDFVAVLERNGFVKSFEQMQPEHRQVVDLKPLPDEIFKQMKPKGRYNINVAKRHGVRVTTGEVKTFYQLYRQSAKREKFAARVQNYFEDLIKHFPDQVEIFIASYQNQPVAAALVVFWKGVASYLYGGSAGEHRNVMAPTLLHWKIIEEAKRRKMKQYDLLAIAPDDKPHKFAGLRRFKQQFGGRQVDLVGSWDLIFRPWWYRIYRLAESVRRH